METFDLRRSLERATGRDLERFWGVKLELTAALGNAKGTVSKQALLKGLKATDARVRRACVDGLGKLGSDAEVAAT